MNITGFYVTKKQNVIEEKHVVMAIQELAKVGVSAVVITQITPILMTTVGSPIVAHASTTTASGLEPAVGKVLTLADEVIDALQKVAKPVAYGFCMKGILEKISGKEHEGSKHMKEAVKGYITVQLLPVLFDIVDFFK